MAFADNIRGIEFGIMARLRNVLGRAVAGFARRRNFHRTYNELSNLNDRALEDLGVARAQIAEVARHASYGN